MSTSATVDAEFTAFVADAGPRLHRTARLLAGDPHRAEELLQATLVKTYLAWPRAQATDPEAYARRVLANQRIDTWRKHRREVLTPPADVPEAAIPSTADDAADRDEVVRALMTLTPRQRRVVVLRHLVGLTEAEVAADLGVSVGTVKSTASRGLGQLREILAPGRLEADVDVERRAMEQGHGPGAPSAGAAIARATTVRRRRRMSAVAAAALGIAAVVIGVSVLTRDTVVGGAPMADWPVYGSVTAAAAASDVVVEGTVLDERTQDVDVDLGSAVELETFVVYRVEVTGAYAGAAVPGDVVEVGVMAEAGRPTEEPRLTVGETYVLFLAESFDGRPRHLINPFEAVYGVADDGSLAAVSADPRLALTVTQAELEALEP